MQTKIGGQLEKAREKLGQAGAFCAQANTRKTRGVLRPALRKVAQASTTLGSRQARDVPAPLRKEFRAAAAALSADMRTLQRSVSCPAGGA